MTLVLGLFFLAISFVIWQILAYRTGPVFAFGTVGILLILCIDFLTPKGPLWFDSEDWLFGVPGSASYDRLGAVLLAWVAGPAGLLGAIFGTFAGLRRRDRRLGGGIGQRGHE